MNCKAFHDKLPDLILDTQAFGLKARKHLASCEACEKDYSSMMATLAALDAWKAPEPSIYFDQRLSVLLREEQRVPRLGFFARLRDHMLFNTGRQFRPAAAGVLALVIMLGGGSYAGLQGVGHHDVSGQVSATVNDLQTLDKNEPALQQMDQLLQDDDATSDDSGSNAPS